MLIPTLNEAQQIETVLTQLIEGDDLAARSLVIVADGGSTDTTCEIVSRLQGRFPNLHLLNNPERIQAAAMNLLLSSDFDNLEFVVRCDAHAAYPRGYVSDLIHCILEKDVDSVVVPMDAVANTNGCFQRGLAWVADTPIGSGGSPHRGGVRSGYCDHGHHAAFRMSTFRKLGGYDTHFRTNEDAEYDKRLVIMGGCIWLNADIRIKYFPRLTPVSLWKQYFQYGVGRAQTCLKHGTWPAVRQLVPVAHTIFLAICLLTLGISPVSLVWPVLYLVIVASCGLWVAFQRQSLCGLTAAVALATMHLAWGIGFLSLIIPRGFMPHTIYPAE